MDQQTTPEGGANHAPAADTPPDRLAFVKRNRTAFMIGGPVLVLLVVGFVLLTGGRFVSTDNAYVRAARVAVSTSVPGRIVSVAVHENDRVKKGDVLLELDPGSFAVNVEQAQAELSAARLQVVALRAGYRQRVADLDNAQDTLAYANREKKRQHDLMNAGVSSRQDYDRAAHDADQAASQLAGARQALAAALADLGGSGAANVDAHPRVKQARAAYDQAKLNLGYTKVIAAADGVVTKVDQVEVGSYVNTSQPLFWLISGAPWIEANFKEDQLAHLHPGQEAEIKIDAFPGKKIKGRLASFSPGTGASFSLLPPENATGNWVKVSQRLPVQFEIVEAPKEVFLAAGLSASVKVDTHSEAEAKTVVAAKP